MKDSSISSISLQVLDAIGENLGGIDKKQIIAAINKRYSCSLRDGVERQILKLLKKEVIYKNDDLFTLSSEIKPCYSQEIKEIWERLKKWEHRTIFFD